MSIDYTNANTNTKPTLRTRFVRGYYDYCIQNYFGGRQRPSSHFVRKILRLQKAVTNRANIARKISKNYKSSYDILKEQF